MEEILKYEKDALEKNPDYLGNTPQGYYLFKYASMNEEFKNDLLYLIDKAIAQFNDVSALKFSSNAVVKSNRLFFIDK